MFGWWKTRTIQKQNAFSLYKACVLQARTPDFYEDLGVEDTMEGRFEMVCLHAAIILEWLYKNNQDSLAQKFFDVMFVDIDRNLREEGVGDLAIPKRIKKMMKGFKGRTFAYRNGVEKGTLPDVIKKNIGLSDQKMINILSDYIENGFLNIQTIDFEKGINQPRKLFIRIDHEQKSAA